MSILMINLTLCLVRTCYCNLERVTHVIIWQIWRKIVRLVQMDCLLSCYERLLLSWHILLLYLLGELLKVASGLVCGSYIGYFHCLSAVFVILHTITEACI